MKTKFYIFEGAAMPYLCKVENNTFYVHTPHSWVKNNHYSNNLDNGYPIGVFFREISKEDAFKHILENSL